MRKTVPAACTNVNGSDMMQIFYIAGNLLK